jgi:hypothetical protein
MNGWAFLGVNALLCACVFLNGLRFARMSDEEALNPRILLEMPNRWGGRERTKGEAARLFGRMSMIAAPLYLIFVAVLCFGLLGPVNGIETIDLN